MGHSKLRVEQDCLNCGNIVKERYCGHCGQENAESRHSFYYLFTHFFEDFTHYESNFWRTIRLLLFKPGALTNLYLSGKRNSYVEPVKLYIFVSFITFFLIALLPTTSKREIKSAILSDSSGVVQERLDADFAIYPADSLRKAGIHVPEIDKYVPEDKKIEVKAETGVLNFLERLILVKLDEMGSVDKLNEKLSEKIGNSIPKILFLYLPLFAFFLWLFHDKKRWWYFDHGIFTLHYFAFILITTLFLKCVDVLAINLGSIASSILDYAKVPVYIYLVVYFFIAHYRVYQLDRKRTFANGIMLFVLNVILILGLALLALIYALYTLH